MIDLYGKRVLVTGGAGFVGSQLAARLAREGARVIVLDNLFTGRREAVPPCVDLVVGSVTDANMVNRLVGECELVYHLAVRNIIVSTSEPEADLQTNVAGTLNVLLAARECGARVVYTSSVSVYGQADDLPIRDHTPVSLLSPYAVSKYAAECYCRLAWQSWYVPVTILRLSNVYGPGQTPRNPYCGVVGRFMAAAHAGQPLEVNGDGSQTRDYVYIADTVDALIRAGTLPGAIGQTLTLGTGVETSAGALAQIIIGLYGHGSIEHVAMRDIDKIIRRVIDPGRAQAYLGWQAMTPLGAGLNMTKDWIEAQA